MANPIDAKYQQLKSTLPTIGDPVGPEKVCADGIGRYREYSGNASIYFTPTTGAHVVYGLIRAKWIALGREQGPNGYPKTDEMDAASGKGRFNNFQKGTIIWRKGTNEAFSVHGEIYKKWGETSYDKGILGFPISDEKAAAEKGRHSRFENGAIYYHASTATHIVRPPVLNAWESLGAEGSWLGYPKSDTPELLGASGSATQTFKNGSIEFMRVASKSLVSPSTTVSIGSNGVATLSHTTDPKDDRRLASMILTKRVHFRTAFVLFRGSYTRSLSATEILEQQHAYNTGMSKLEEFTFGLAHTDHTHIVLDDILSKSDFNDYDDGDPSTFKAEFKRYDKVGNGLAERGLSVDDVDVISIGIPWTDSGSSSASGFAWANPKFKFANTKTYSTIHYLYPKPYWWAFHLHETFHTIEWMLQGEGYAALRNPDESWWKTTFPTMTNANGISPPPMNVGDPGEYLLYAMLMRIKEHWTSLPGNWGHIVKSDLGEGGYGDVLLYSAPDAHTIVESSYRTRCIPA